MVSPFFIVSRATILLQTFFASKKSLCDGQVNKQMKEILRPSPFHMKQFFSPSQLSTICGKNVDNFVDLST